jgi:hypothetical protein
VVKHVLDSFHAHIAIPPAPSRTHIFGLAFLYGMRFDNKLSYQISRGFPSANISKNAMRSVHAAPSAEYVSCSV